MRARLGTTALVAGIIAGMAAVTSEVGAQAAAPRPVSEPHFALFGGRAATLDRGPENGFELGVSGDLRWHPIPVPIRLSVSFSQRADGERAYYARKGGLASLEAVMRPLPRKFGIRPYFLAGLGVGTRAGYDFWSGGYYADRTIPPQPLVHVFRPRESWAFASAGLGLDMGHAFVQLRILNPVASQGPVLVPLSLGFRFWD